MNDEAAGRPADLFAILHSAHAAEGEVESRLNAVGLSMPRLLALEALSAAGEPLPLGQLADRLSCVKSNITQLIDRLEADGLVERRQDPRDRRARLAALTDAGRNACEEGLRVREEAGRQVLEALTSDEVRQLAVLMSKLGDIR